MDKFREISRKEAVEISRDIMHRAEARRLADAVQDAKQYDMEGEMEKNVDIVVGMQYGSEAKGLVCQTIAPFYNLAVRTGGANAGHTIRWPECFCQASFTPGIEQLLIQTGTMNIFKARHIPSTILNPNCQLALSAGALINLDVLDEEIQYLKSVGIDIESRLHVDPNAGIVEKRHVADEHEKKGGVDLNEHQGSTREGIGAALIDRIGRRNFKLAYMEPYLQKFVGGKVCDLIRSSQKVLLEGSQGSLLSLYHGPWPYTTSRDVNASGIAAECGVPPHSIRNVIGVVRTYPIRVAGRSGPAGGREITWHDLSAKLGRPVEEKTTVTKRVRRIFEFSMDDFKYAVVLNRPNILACTFLNYINKDDEGIVEFDKLSKESRRFIDDIEAVAQCPILLMSTSADTVIVRGELNGYLQ